MALGELGMTVDYFYSLTPREFDNACYGYRKQQEIQMQAQWSQTRMIMWAALAPHQKKGSNLTPQKLMVFDWEKNNPETPGFTSPEDEAAAIQKSIEMWNRLDAVKEKQIQPE